MREVTGDLNTAIARCKTERWQPEQYSFEQVLAAGSVTFLEETMQGCGLYCHITLGALPRTGYPSPEHTTTICPLSYCVWLWCQLQDGGVVWWEEEALEANSRNNCSLSWWVCSICLWKLSIIPVYDLITLKFWSLDINWNYPLQTIWQSQPSKILSCNWWKILRCHNSHPCIPSW